MDSEVKFMRRAKQVYDLSGIDKREAAFTVKIPTKTKCLVEKLDREDKTALIDAILITITSFLHDDAFDPKTYLKS